MSQIKICASREHTHRMQPHSQAWYVLNYIPPSSARRDSIDSVIDRFNRSTESAVDLFAPTFTTMERDSTGKWKRRERPLLFHYVFVLSDTETLKHLCSSQAGLSFVIDHAGNSRYLTLPDGIMQQLRIIARVHNNDIPCFLTEEIDLEEGDIVEVADGPFAGLSGTYVTRQGSSKGTLHIAVGQGLSAIVYDLSARYVRVLSFAPGTKRGYDLTDAFLPRLLDALQTHTHREPLSTSQRAKLVAFTRRMGKATLKSDKHDAKLQLLLMAAHTLLGEHTDAEMHRRQFDTMREAITNPWTAALAAMIESRLFPGDTTAASHLNTLASTLPAPRTRAQRLLASHLPN